MLASREQIPKQKVLWCTPLLALSYVLYNRSLICFPKEPSKTSWGAPIVWEGTFDRKEDTYLRQARGTVVGLSVFAVGKYLDAYLEQFLVSANLYFMPGLPSVVYILTDRPSDVPTIPVRSGMSITTLQVSNRGRWQDISMLRMMDLKDLLLPLARDQVDYLFCADVDQIFSSSYGPETLGNLVAQIHSGYYLQSRKNFPYERNPLSAAFIPPSMGTFYYHAAMFGGAPAYLANLTSSCLRDILLDKKKGLEAIWQDESHLNRYFTLEHLPTKVLSPEYCWDNKLWLKYHRLRWAEKNYEETRVTQTQE
ncbi:N-acetyllactosaminide alpha-1,3-galactosyltransferase-like [Bufo gargarizans]|uniref:N-acetyllactosaminide alpha-1,3-galactosyltransferase-like n=1 Tax=Bufo gargarizans TaxID=30331 RepID=UPI001CF40419|nr:N-acetyllactosaminide alpha-1,3-galactosyltransferase-like [Bufo gargarizans]